MNQYNIIIEAERATVVAKIEASKDVDGRGA